MPPSDTAHPPGHGAGRWREPGLRPVADPAATVVGDRYRITVLTDGLLRLEHAADGVFEDRASTFAVCRELPVPRFRVTDRGGVLELVTDRLRLVYDRGPFSAAGLAVEARGGVSSHHSVWHYGEPADGEGGTARTLDAADGPVPLGPGVVSRHGITVLDDSRSMLLTDDGWVADRDGSRADLYVFAYGHDYRTAVRDLYRVSGPQPVLPRWALGVWWSRYRRYSDAEYRALVERFAAEGLPVGVAVLDMDWHVTDVDPALGSGWTGYTWDRVLFPDPPALLAWLHERGLRVALNVHPADGVRAHEDAYLAMCRALGREPDGDPVTFDPTDRAFMATYFDVLHHGLEADGVDFWWIDWQSGTTSRLAGVDPLWMLNRLHFLDAARGGRRPVTFSRYAGPGSHRYPVGFSGDTVVSWRSLAFQPRFTATAANIGYGWWSHDIGGHMFGARDDELATRWLQLGCFSPVLRLHSTDNPFLDKAPWGAEPAAREVQTRFWRLRQRLVPYLHTMNHRAARDGVPLVVPMYHDWPDQPEAYRVDHQFRFGSQLVVAAVTRPADPVSRLAACRTWLPPGRWVDVLTGRVYDGDRLVDLHRDLESLPVLAAPGAVVPLDGAAVPGDDPVNPTHLELWVVPGADGGLDLVEDDGTGDGRDPGRLAVTPLTWHDADATLVVGPTVGDVGAVPDRRTWTLALIGGDLAADPCPTARVDGVAVPVTTRRDADGCRVTVPDVPATARLQVGVAGPVAPTGPDVAATVQAVLDRAWCDYRAKAEAYRAATADRPAHVRLGHLQALDLPGPVLAAVTEALTARA